MFTRFVQVGRVVLINYGEDAGKLATIIDVVDQNKCLIDGADIKRQVIPFKRVALTDFTVKVARNARTKTLAAAWKKEDIVAKWGATSWAKKLIAKEKRAKLTDFERFQVMKAKQKKAAILK